jgi:hypothetical protein
MPATLPRHTKPRQVRNADHDENQKMSPKHSEKQAHTTIHRARPHALLRSAAGEITVFPAKNKGLLADTARAAEVLLIK